MSKDGYLPPGCTEKDVDMAAPDWDSEREEFERRLLIERTRRAVRQGLDFLRENDPLWYQLILSDHKERT